MTSSDDLPKTKLKMSVADSLKKALLKLKEQENDKPAISDGERLVLLLGHSNHQHLNFLYIFFIIIQWALLI